MAQGLSNAGIGRDLFISAKTVETHIATVFAKLGLSGDNADPDRNRRVLAVLAHLRSGA
jgi:DNA-binding NarL/FixJ family response regulator